MKCCHGCSPTEMYRCTAGPITIVVTVAVMSTREGSGILISLQCVTRKPLFKIMFSSTLHHVSVNFLIWSPLCTHLVAQINWRCEESNIYLLHYTDLNPDGEFWTDIYLHFRQFSVNRTDKCSLTYLHPTKKIIINSWIVTLFLSIMQMHASNGIYFYFKID